MTGLQCSIKEANATKIIQCVTLFLLLFSVSIYLWRGYDRWKEYGNTLLTMTYFHSLLRRCLLVSQYLRSLSPNDWLRIIKRWGDVNFIEVNGRQIFSSMKSGSSQPLCSRVSSFLARHDLNFLKTLSLFYESTEDLKTCEWWTPTFLFFVSGL